MTAAIPTLQVPWFKKYMIQDVNKAFVYIAYSTAFKAICQDSSILFIIAVVFNGFASNVLLQLPDIDTNIWRFDLKAFVTRVVATRLLGYIRT